VQSKKKKKKATATVNTENIPALNSRGSGSPAPPIAKGQIKPSGKKGKGKEKKPDKDDLDQALAELSVKYI
jgi:hypothetical protein